MWAIFDFFEGQVSISPCVLPVVFAFFGRVSISPRAVRAALTPLSRAVTVVMLYAAVNAASSPPYLSVGMCEISTGAQKLEGHSPIEKFRRDVALLVSLGLVTAVAFMEVFPQPVLEGDMQVEFWRTILPMMHDLLSSFVHWHPVWQVRNGRR